MRGESHGLRDDRVAVTAPEFVRASVAARHVQSGSSREEAPVRGARAWRAAARGARRRACASAASWRSTASRSRSPSGELLGLIGPNGAGKTTLFNCFSRLYTPISRRYPVRGQSILGRPPHRIAELGIGRTFQNLALFRTMSVLDNVSIGGHPRSRSDFVSDALKLPWAAREEQRSPTSPGS